VTRLLAIALTVSIVGACAAPVAGPGETLSPTSTIAPTALPTVTAAPATPVEPTPNRTSEPVPTPPPQASAPQVRIVSQSFTIAPATTLIEVVGRYRTDTEISLRSWVPAYLQALDKYRSDPSEQNRAVFDSMHAPGPYTEFIRQSLAPWYGPPGVAAPKRTFEIGQLAIQHMYAKPWGRVAYIDAALTYTDRIMAADGTTSAVQHVQQGRYVNQGQGFYKVIDGYDAVVSRWVDGEQPRWSALALEAEAPLAIGYFLQRESYVPGEPYAHGAPPGQRFLIAPFDKARNDGLLALDASYAKGEFTSRRFADVSVRVSRFEPATFLGDGVVTVVVSGQLVTAVGAAQRTIPVTRTLRFYRITRDGLNAFWLVVDEQGSNGEWLSGGDLALAEIDQDRG
jgi:hypothetical protein